MDAGQCSEYNQNEGWVVVNTNVQTKLHTRSRSPQYNGDNEPSRHKANASTSPSRKNSFTFEVVEGFDYSYPTLNNGSSNTATSGTATFAGIQDTTLRAQYAPETKPSAGKHTLTKSSLHRHQEELEHLAAVNVPGWIAQSGTEYRFAQYHASTSTHRSMAVGRSMHSTTESATYGSDPNFQSSVGIEDIFAAGSWCDAPIDALINSSSYLRIDSE